MEELTEQQAKVFKCNEESGVSEWCVAYDKKMAYEFMLDLWGNETMQEYYENADSLTLSEFIEDFFKEEPCKKDFNIEGTTKKISDWIKESDIVPRYLCCEEF